MRRHLIAALIAAAPSSALAATVEGVWKTEPGDGGGHLEITIAPCASDASKTCGVISKAYSKDGPDDSYVNLGKPIVENMVSEDGINFSDGTIWDPESDRVYDSNMTLKGDILDVEGCVMIICSGQDWTRVK